MIGLIIGQKLKLEHPILCQSISGVHIVFQNFLGGIKPVSIIVGPRLGIIGKGFIHKASPSLKLIVNHSIPVKTRIHLHKGPVGMLLLQSGKGCLIACGKLFDVHIPLGSVCRVGNHICRRIHSVACFPLQKFFIGARQKGPGNISLILLGSVQQAYVLPDLVIIVHKYVLDLHHLSAGYGYQYLRVIGSLRTHRIFIAQIHQSHDIPLLYNLLKRPSGLLNPDSGFLIQSMGFIGEYAGRKQTGH